ncbi:MAG: hypothetical protein ABSB42_14340 [Tepidisphaeraceae bacterium]
MTNPGLVPQPNKSRRVLWIVAISFFPSGIGLMLLVGALVDPHTKNGRDLGDNIWPVGVLMIIAGVAMTLILALISRDERAKRAAAEANARIRQIIVQQQRLPVVKSPDDFTPTLEQTSIPPLPSANTSADRANAIKLLRDELRKLQDRRKDLNTLSFIFGVPGLLILVFGPWEAFLTHQVVLGISIILAGWGLLMCGFACVAKYMGQNPCWGICSISLRFLRDLNKERIVEIEATLKAWGEPD